MARIPRILITGEPTAYHVISRTALDGYPIGEAEKDYFESDSHGAGGPAGGVSLEFYRPPRAGWKERKLSIP